MGFIPYDRVTAVIKEREKKQPMSISEVAAAKIVRCYIDRKLTDQEIVYIGRAYNSVLEALRSDLTVSKALSKDKTD